VKIGITYTGKDDKQSNYIHWIKGSEPSIEVITLAPGETKIVEELDGLVFSGGVDIHPNCFGGAEQYDHMPRKFWKERDDFEFAVFDKAVKMELPVLGVCRGLQLINVFQKGTLVQDLSERNNRHESFIDGATEKDRTHTVVVEKHSLLGSIATNEGLVNSAHHQSIDSLGNDLMANSFALYGVIDGI
jgi:putative glutamine amidotransferase